MTLADAPVSPSSRHCSVAWVCYVVFGPVTLLAFSSLDGFVRIRCERAYLERWRTIITRHGRVQDLERRGLSLPIHLAQAVMYIDIDRRRAHHQQNCSSTSCERKRLWVLRPFRLSSREGTSARLCRCRIPFTQHRPSKIAVRTAMVLHQPGTATCHRSPSSCAS